MSLIYAGGDRATAIASIKAAAAARIVTNADGTKSLDVESMVSWLNGQFAQMATDHEATSPGYMNGIDTRSLALQLASAIAPTTLKTRADWPNMTVLTDPNSIASALATAFAELKTLSNAVTAAYTDARDKVAGLILDYISAFISPTMPQGIQRMIETRAYLHTYVTDRQEESAPSPASELIELDQNDSASGSIPAAPGDRYITKARLYRSNLSQVSAARAEWQLVKEVPLTPGVDTAWTDEVPSAELGEVCSTTTWEEPPATLRNLVALPNGILAGIVGDTNTLAFCEPNVPYAWPPDYQQTVEHKPLGCGVFGQTMFVGTKGNPVFISGADSASMSALKIPSNQALSSVESIARGEGGLVFASPDGLCVADANGVRVLTAGIFAREDWQKLDPTSMRCAIHDGIVYAIYSGNGGGCLAVSLADQRIGTVDLAGSALTYDLLTDTLFSAQGTSVVPLFTGGGRRTALRRSKRYVLDQPTSIAWLQCNSDYSAPVTVRVYGDGALIHARVLTSIAPVRFPAGRWLELEIEVETQARVTSITLASNVSALQGAAP